MYDAGTRRIIDAVPRAERRAGVQCRQRPVFWGLDNTTRIGSAVEIVSGRKSLVPSKRCSSDRESAGRHGRAACEPASGLLQLSVARQKPAPFEDRIPSNGALVQGIVTIQGTATDVNGTVAGVEVSSMRCHLAPGGRNGGLELRLAGAANLDRATILSRAIDDSNNIQTDCVSISVRGPGTGDFHFIFEAVAHEPSRKAMTALSWVVAGSAIVCGCSVRSAG